MQSFFRTLGLNMIDNKGNVIMSKEEIQLFMKQIKKMYDEYGLNETNINATSMEFYMNCESYAGIGNGASLYAMLVELAEHEGYKINSCGIPSIGNEGKYYTQIVLYGAINNNSKNKQEGYNLLKYIMNYSDKKSASRAIPVKKDNYTDIYNTIIRGKLQYTISSTEKRETRAWTDEELDVYDDIINNINATVPNNNIEKIMTDSYDSYIKGTDSFESCYGIMQDKIQLYLHE